MTFKHLKTNSAKFSHYRLQIRKVIEFSDFQSVMQHPLYATSEKSTHTEYIEISQKIKQNHIHAQTA